MPDDSKSMTAPYAPASNVIGIIRRYRERRLPEVLTPEILAQAGVPRGNTPRTLAALKFLGLVHEDGGSSERFGRLSQATSSQYREQLAQIIRAAFAPIFKQVDPTTADDLAIADAFRQYQPHAQRDRMISLFRGLCREAELIEGGPPETRRSQRAPRPVGQETTDDYSLLTSLFRQLPENRSWTREQRDRWLRAFEGNLNLIIEVVD